VTGTRSTLVAVLVVTAVGLMGCRDKSDPPVRPAGSVPSTAAPSTSTALATGSGTSFCIQARALDTSLLAVGESKNPDQLRSAVAGSRSAFDTARVASTPALSGDVEVLAGAYGQVFGAMEAAGYDVAGLSVGAFQPLLAPEVKAASGRLRDYVNNDC
jgi:hypothetical protein